MSSPDADTSSITIPCCTVSPESSATLNPPGITTLFPFESVTSVFGSVNSFPEFLDSSIVSFAPGLYRLRREQPAAVCSYTAADSVPCRSVDMA